MECISRNECKCWRCNTKGNNNTTNVICYMILIAVHPAFVSHLLDAFLCFCLSLFFLPTIIWLNIFVVAYHSNFILVMMKNRIRSRGVETALHYDHHILLVLLRARTHSKTTSSMSIIFRPIIIIISNKIVIKYSEDVVVFISHCICYTTIQRAYSRQHFRAKPRHNDENPGYTLYNDTQDILL